MIEIFFLAETDGRKELSQAALRALGNKAVDDWPQMVSKLPNASAEAVEKLASAFSPPREPQTDIVLTRFRLKLRSDGYSCTQPTLPGPRSTFTTVNGDSWEVY